MNTQCITMVAVPTVNGVNMLTTQGTLEIGEVPRSKIKKKSVLSYKKSEGVVLTDG